MEIQYRAKVEAQGYRENERMRQNCAVRFRPPCDDQPQPCIMVASPRALPRSNYVLDFLYCWQFRAYYAENADASSRRVAW